MTPEDLKKELRTRNLTGIAAAPILKMYQSQLSTLLTGRRPITPLMADAIRWRLHVYDREQYE